MADQARTTTEEAELAADGGGLVDEAKSVANDLKTAAVEQGRLFVEGARLQATTYADERKNEAAASVSDIASSLRETGRTFGERPNIQAFVDSAADGLEQLATGLRERSFAELYGEAEDFARRQPVVVGAVAVAAGFLLARFIKSSADEMSETSAAIRAKGGRLAKTRREPAPPRAEPDV